LPKTGFGKGSSRTRDPPKKKTRSKRVSSRNNCFRTGGDVPEGPQTSCKNGRVFPPRGRHTRNPQ